MTENWQPIETAPKDGTWVLITRHDTHPRSACYDNAEETFHDWESDSFFAGGWTDYDDNGPPWHLTKRYTPSHWMPLPPPPAP